MIPTINSFSRAAMILFTGCLIACASYPDDPNKPNTVDDEYTIEEDGFLSVPKEEGILVNDTAGEGTEITLISLDELNTAEGGRIVLVEDGSFTYEPQADFYGTDQAEYTIKNDKGKTASGKIYFIVTPDNDAPAISPISDQTTLENTAVDITFTVTDLDTDPNNLVITAESDNTTLVPDGAMSISGNGETYTLSVTPAAEQYGSATISLTVSDGSPPDVLTAQTDFVLTVTEEINSPPTIEPITDQTTNWRSSVTVPIIISDAETPAEQLELNVTSSDEDLVSDSGIVLYGIGTDHAVVITPNRYAVGNLTIEITVTDGGDSNGEHPLTTTESFGLTLESAFRPNLSQSESTGKYIATQNQNFTLLEKEAAAGQSIRMTATDILLAFYHGEITVNKDGRITYSPQSKSSGENFVADLKGGGQRLSSEAYRLPTVEPDHYVTPAAQVLELSSTDGLLSNDRDPAGLDLTIAEPGLFDTLFGGTVQLRPDGGFSYDPPINYQGSDGFAYSVTNGVNSVMGIAIISISP